jgi:prolyl 4-hydroxylase
MMIYLNSTDEGGITQFPRIDTEFNPKEGMAVIWSSLNSDGSPNTNSLHHAQPVLKGYKAIITKWFRSNSYLENPPPMLFRQSNDYIPNYTKRGFDKAKLPQALVTKIQSFYATNLESQTIEDVPGDFIVNSDNSGMQSSVLVELSAELREEIHEELKSMMENWCEEELIPTFVYGIRSYQRGAVLKCHQDRHETHIISAIINVDQKVDEDWPLSIEDNYYRHHKVILKPGEIIFYEGGRLSHGRPTPLEGDFFANIFCHFKPKNYVPR